MRFSVTVWPGTAPSPVSVLGYSFPSYCPAYENAAVAPVGPHNVCRNFHAVFSVGRDGNNLRLGRRRSFELRLRQVERPTSGLDVLRPARNGNNHDGHRYECKLFVHTVSFVS